MKRLFGFHIYACILALGLQGCSLFGVSPEDAEEARSRAEAAVAVAELATGFANVAATKYAQLPDCVDGGPVVCKDPVVATALVAGVHALGGRLADVRAALASGLNDGERLALITDALVKAAGDVNDIVAQIRGTAAAEAIVEIGQTWFATDHMPEPLG